MNNHAQIYTHSEIHIGTNKILEPFSMSTTANTRGMIKKKEETKQPIKDWGSKAGHDSTSL